MGVSTFLVGCLPTYGQVGILAPILLVVLRLLQGLSAAGEQAGANSMSFEHAPDDRRGFFTSFTLSGTQGGQILAPAVFLPLAAVLSDDQLQSWGWRIPFWISAVVVVVGLHHPPPARGDPGVPGRGGRATRPRARRSPCSSATTGAACCGSSSRPSSPRSTRCSRSSPSTSRPPTTTASGSARTRMLWLAIVANVVAICVIPFWATLSDRVGRKPVFVTGLLGSAVLVVAFLGAIAARPACR